MKKLNILFLTLVLIITSCSNSDDNDSTSISGDITGNWEGVISVEYGGTFWADGPSPIIGEFIGEASNISLSLRFDDGSNSIVSQGTYNAEVTHTISNNTFVLNFDNLEFLDDGTWSIEGETLTVISNGITKIATIIELTNTSLKLATRTESSESNANRITDVVITFTRQ